MGTSTDVCVSCRARVRPPKTKLADYPGTVLLAARGRCWACYQSASKRGALTAPVVSDEAPSVPVRTLLRQSTFRQLLAHADARKVTVGELLCMLADASLKPKKGAR